MVIYNVIMTIDESILRRIKKCLALSSSSEPHEAAAALRQAQKLMELHGVSQIDLGRSDLGEAEVKSKVSVSRIKDWELKLLNTVARSFGCKLLWLSSSSYSSSVYGKYILIGLKTQVQLAQYTADVLQRKVVKARSEFVKTLPTWYSRGSKTLEADGFCHGWVEAISRTVHEFALNDDTKALIQSEFESQSVGEAKVQHRAAGTNGLRAGFESGSGESIHRPMGNETFLKIN